MAIDIIHQPDRQRFVSLQDGEESVLEYRLLPGHGIDFNRTFVPEALRGHGIAERLVRTGMRWAREQDYEPSASCWYAKRFLKRHERN